MHVLHGRRTESLTDPDGKINGKDGLLGSLHFVHFAKVPWIRLGFGALMVEEFVGSDMFPATGAVECLPKRCHRHSSGDGPSFV